ncbi:hypothetical protein, partial [Acinetobacter sp. ACNIH4]|uniref:hypothetical protein n=1 Tax=Acinetobacter sp. ACNIH4 TaxID=1985875 RepID=UPI001BC88DC5
HRALVPWEAEPPPEDPAERYASPEDTIPGKSSRSEFAQVLTDTHRNALTSTRALDTGHRMRLEE